MKRRMLLCLGLAALLLSGCSAMLNRSYSQITPHEERPSLAGDSSVYQAESYGDLVNALLFFVSQGMEEGVIRISSYQPKPGEQADVPAAVSRACTEVTAEDPLGNYAVDYIIPECTRVINAYEASISIAYRRTPEQIRSVIPVTGTGAIRQALQKALQAFSGEVVLRAGYYTEDAGHISTLLSQAYYNTPAAALGMPAATVTLYPEEGTQHVVEILLTYSQDTGLLRERSELLVQKAAALSLSLDGLLVEDAVQTCVSRLRHLCEPLPDGTPGANTAYAALIDGQADSEGLALAFQLLCQDSDLEATIVQGFQEGHPHFWNLIRMEDGDYRHVDLTLPETFYTDAQLLALEYSWNREDYHPAGPAVEETVASSPLEGEHLTPPEETPAADGLLPSGSTTLDAGAG